MKKVIVCGNGGLLQYVINQLQEQEDFIIEQVYEGCEELREQIIGGKEVILAVSWHETETWILKLKTMKAKSIYRIPLFVMQYNLKIFNEGQFVKDRFAYITDSQTNLLYLETHIADTCNLKCKGCMHFSNFATESNFPDLGDFENSFKRLSELFSNIFIIRLMGGEPLVNSNLHRYIEIVRKYFPVAELRIVSNGLLIPNQKRELWEAMRKYHVTMDISPYPPTMDRIENIKNILNEQKIPYGSIAEKLSLFRKSLTKEPVNDPCKSTLICQSNHCHFLRNGKIAKCPLPILIEDFNKQYGTEIHSNDVYDIYQEKSGIELKTKLERYCDICRYCPDHEGYIEWNRTCGDAQMSDWILE